MRSKRVQNNLQNSLILSVLSQQDFHKFPLTNALDYECIHYPFHRHQKKITSESDVGCGCALVFLFGLEDVAARDSSFFGSIWCTVVLLVVARLLESFKGSFCLTWPDELIWLVVLSRCCGTFLRITDDECVSVLSPSSVLLGLVLGEEL